MPHVRTGLTRRPASASRAFRSPVPTVDVPPGGAPPPTPRETPVTRSLVIVESPAKAKTIAKYLGNDYIVESSIGHVRDLARPSELSKEEREKSDYIKTYAVDVEDDFKPLYVVSPDRKQHIAHLKRELKDVDQLLLATDEDREGESIAWHLLEVLKPKVPVKRMVFHEITKKAIVEALDHVRDVDEHLVDAQEARRVLDRLYGFAMSDMTRRKGRGKSAGRVQSVATRIVVERERERQAFRSASYWDLSGLFGEPDVTAQLTKVNGKSVAEGRDFGQDGKLATKRDVVVLDQGAANALAAALKGQGFAVSKVERKPYTRRPAAPFTTSTLQQEAGRKLRWGAQQTMRTAQRLYENGFITYMRTDSTSLSDTAIAAARKQIAQLYTAADLPPQPRLYKNNVKNAQEAHEAIRPAGDEFKTPKELSRELNDSELKLYELIWQRTVASQMADLRGESLVVTIEGTSTAKDDVTFVARGNSITFPGFLKVYVEGSDDPEAELESKETHLPDGLVEGKKLSGRKFDAIGHETKPPARFTEASLVKELERLGVGRPSTYASIMTVIEDRGYVWKQRGSGSLIPSFKAFQVVRLLEEHFPHLVDYQFTARMEDDLDSIANGQEKRTRYLERFFRGGGEVAGLEKLVEEKLANIDLDEIKRLETFPVGTDDQGRAIVLRIGQYGPYLQVLGPDGEPTGDTASVPDDLPPDELTVAKASELLAAPSGDRTLGTDPETELPVVLKNGRFGAYVQLGEPQGKKDKPKTASLFKSMSPETVTLAQALQILALPREVGVAEDGETVFAANGRYGPYLTKGKENRSLETEAQIFSITLPEALHVLAQPKKGRQQRGADAPPLRELGNDPVSGGKVVLKQGRFGPYVTDGETNASLRTGDDAGTITPERAYELLVLRREREATNPKKAAKKKKAAPKKAAAAKKSASTKAASDGEKPKKAAAKKSAAKKPAKKAAAKKSAAKKPAKSAAAKAGSDSDGAAAKKVAKKSVEVSPDV
ncbi:MAG: type I DNA topoisomerase [Sandaracinus sp.]|nr:type I DNA topoisomerase [Sandaracinus sp.]